MTLKKKITFLMLLAITVSMLAIAGRIIKHRHDDDHMEKSPALPPARDEYAKLIQKFLAPASAVRLSGEISLYDGGHPNMVKEKSTFTFIRNGQNVYSRLSFQETLFNGKFLVQVDSLHKLVFITPVRPGEQEQGVPGDPVGLTSKLFSDTATFKVSGSISGDDNLRSIIITSDFNPEIQQLTIWYSPADYSMKMAEVRFYKNGRRDAESVADPNELWISKVVYHEPPAKDPDVNERMGKIFTTHGHQIEPTAAYSNYRVILK